VPGFSVFRELELYVRAGFTPMEALQAATSVSAKAMKLDAEVGTLAVGKRADLLILDANPLENISNARKVRQVMANGLLFDPAPLFKAGAFVP
jgi:imidazolonepropionase-like amidohydrolase